jgi:D-alanyl-lipoteichoic acid acyltransferase DltB (MBOAT superfamily)
MLLGGLWHGAGWTFVIWGGLHGLYLVVHQWWQALRGRESGDAAPAPSLPGRVAARLLTFICVVVAWVFFRATSLDAALRVLGGMAGLNGSGFVSALPLEAFSGARQVAWISTLLAIVWLCPNSQNLVARLKTVKLHVRFDRLAWMSLGGLSMVLVLLAAINGSRGTSEFIYFNF